MKKILILIIILLNLTGCYNYQEMNDLGIVTALGFDYKDGAIEVSAQVVNFKDQKESFVILTSSGKTVYEALRTMSEITSKRLYSSHLKLLIISEDIFKNKTSDFISFLSNYPFSRINFLVAVSKTSSKDIIELSSPFNSESADTVVDTLKLNSKYESIATLTTFDEFLSDLISDGKSPILTRIKILEKSTPSNEFKDDKLIKIEDLITVNKRSEITILSEDESIGYNLLNNKITNTIITSPCEGGAFTVELKWIKSDIKVKSENTFDITANASADMGDFNCTITKENEINSYIKKNVTKEIEDYINKTIKISKTSKTDFIGFGDMLYAHKYKYFKDIKDDWEEKYLENIDYNLKVNIEINKLGNLKTSIKGRDKN